MERHFVQDSQRVDQAAIDSSELVYSVSGNPYIQEIQELLSKQLEVPDQNSILSLFNQLYPKYRVSEKLKEFHYSKKIALRQFVYEILQDVIDDLLDCSQAKTESFKTNFLVKISPKKLPTEARKYRELTEAEKEGFALLEARSQFYMRMSM